MTRQRRRFSVNSSMFGWQNSLKIDTRAFSTKLPSNERGASIKKDWARVQAHELTEEFFIAVRAHKGWDHQEGSGGAKYCHIISIEAEDVTIPVYATVAAVNVEVEAQVAQEIALPAAAT